MVDHWRIYVTWDEQAKVWYVLESTVPGLATGAETIEALERKLETVVPELLLANGAVSETPATLSYLLTVHVVREISVGADAEAVGKIVTEGE